MTADKVCAALDPVAVDAGPGLAQALDDLAASVREEVARRRQIEADRAKPRTAVRWMTLISLGLVLAGFPVPDYSAPYSTLLGQLTLALLAAAFTAVLVWMRSLAGHKPVPRFLVNDPRSSVRWHLLIGRAIMSVLATMLGGPCGRGAGAGLSLLVREMAPCGAAPRCPPCAD